MSRPLELRPGAACRPRTVLSAARALLDPRAGLDGRADLLIRDGVIAEIGDGARAARRAPSSSTPRACTPSRRSSIRTCTCARPGARTRRTSTPARAPRRPAATARSSPSPTPSPVVDSAPVLRSLRERARAEARIPTGFLAAITRRPARASSSPRWPSWRGPGAAGFTDDGLPVALGRRDAPGAPVPAAGRAACSRSTRRTRRCPATARCTRARCRRCSAWPGSRRSRSRRMVARDCALAAYEEGRIHVQHVSARETVEVIERARAAGTQVTCRGHAAPPAADRRGRAHARHQLQDEPAAARRGGPPGADRGAALGSDRLRRHRSRPARARGEGAAVRAGADGGHRPRDRLRRAAHRPGAARACSTSACSSSG